VAAPVLVTDSSSYLPAGLAEALGVRVVPLHVTLGDWSFDEGAVPPAAFYARLRASGDVPTTSQPAPGEFLEVFTAAASAGADRVLCVTCTASMSGTHRAAVLAAGMAPVAVDVVDSGTISGGLTLVVGRLGRELASGTAYDQVLALARSMAGRVRSTWCSDTNALLAAGGRLPDQVPDGVPVLALDGAVRVLGAARSTDEALALQASVVREAARRTPTWVTVGHGDVPLLADQLAGLLDGAPGVLGIDRYVVGPAVGAHAGAGNVGASYLV